MRSKDFFLKKGVRSCGCLPKLKSYRHGYYGTKIYNSYKGMKSRCYIKSNKRYEKYGGRGIIVCDDWLGKNGFKNFLKWSTENGYEEGLTLDRIDNDGNYCPSNCRWVDYKTQNLNRSNTWYEVINGEKVKMQEFIDMYNLNKNALHARKRKGLKGEELLINLKCRIKKYNKSKV